MNESILILLASLLIIAFPIIFAIMKSRKEVVSNDDWTVGGRDLPTYVVVGTQFATAMGGGVLVAVVGMAYDFGLSAMTYCLVGAAPFFIMLIIAPWIRKNNFTTIPDILAHFYGEHKGMAVLGAFFALIVPFGWITSQLGAFGLLYSQITGINPPALVIGVTIVSLFLIMPSGLKTVAWTDFIYSCMMIVIGAVVLIYGFKLAGGSEAVFSSSNIPAKNISFPGGLWSVGASTVFLWFLSSIPGGSTNQIYYQRICSIKDPKKVSLSLIISGLAVYATGMWASSLGFTIRSLNPSLKSGQEATGWFMTQMPTWMLVLFGSLVCAAIMSTISSAAQTVVTNLTKDIYQKTINPEASDKTMVKLARILTVILMALTCVLSLLFPNVLAWLVYTYAFSAAGLLAPMFIGFFTRKKKIFTGKTIFVSMIVSMIVCVIARSANSFGTIIPFTLFGVTASVITMYTGLFLERSRNGSKVTESV